MIVNSLIHQITLGREGRNWGYTMGLPKLESIIDGVTKSTYTLLFSGTGSGKTSLALYAYIYKPAMEHLEDNNFKVSYFSLEMSSELLFAKLLSMYIFDTYGIELSTKQLLSREKNYTLSEDNYNIVKNCLPWLHKMEKIINVYDKGLTADTLYKVMMNELALDGTFEETETRKIYTPNNDELVHLVVIDHLSLCRRSSGRTLKEEMDLISAYLVTLRNMCGISPLVIMQANRDSTSMDRRKAGFVNYTINDTKDSGSPAQDAEIIISIFNPFREKLGTYREYDIKILKSTFRSITVLKNRLGEADIEIGCSFFGKCGLWKELPKPDEIYDYTKYTTPESIKENKNKEKDEENNINKLNFTL